MTSVLYIGGSGEISHACVEAAVANGHDVAVLNRAKRSAPFHGVEQIVGDLRHPDAYDVLDGREFDVVCQFLAFEPAAIERDIETFASRCGQYVFISSASAYRASLDATPITEETPLDNPFWAYSRAKAACEARLFAAHAAGQLPVTVVRPSHTYRTRLPAPISDGDHVAWRMLAGKPVVVHGDGQSRWTVTHASDFAEAFTALCGMDAALGEAFHITDSTSFTWDEIVTAVGDVLGVQPEIVHVPVDELIEVEPAWSGPLLGDKACSMVFDNSKVSAVLGGWQATTPLADGLRAASRFAQQRLTDAYEPLAELDRLFDGLAAGR